MKIEYLQRTNEFIQRQVIGLLLFRLDIILPEMRQLD